MTYGYLQHGFFGRSKDDHKYVRKYMSAAGKWVYVYADDLKKKAESTVTKTYQSAKQSLSALVSKPITLSSIPNGVIAKGEKYVRKMKQNVEDFKAGYSEASSTGKTQGEIVTQARKQYKRNVLMMERYKKRGDYRRASQYGSKAAELNRSARQLFSGSFGLGTAIGSLKYKATRSIEAGKRYVGGHRATTNNVRR